MLGNSSPAVDVKHPDQRFVGVCQERMFSPSAGFFFASIQKDVSSEVDLAGELNKARLAHQIGFHLGQLAFGKVRKAFEQPRAHYEPENRVAQKLHRFVVLAIFVAALVGE